MLEGAEPDHLEYIRELEARLNAAEEALRALRNVLGAMASRPTAEGS